MRPLVHVELAAPDVLAALRRFRAGFDRLVVVEHTVNPTFRVETDTEVRADRGGIARESVADIGGRTVDDRLSFALLLGADPAFDRKLLEKILGVDRARLGLGRKGV